MKHLTIIVVIATGIFLCNPVQSQTKVNISDLPVTIIPAKRQGPDLMVLYISGDGGWNTFSQNLCNQFAADGVPVVALNSLKYFWSRKTPDESAQAVTALLDEYRSVWKKNNILLCGYSFGADVMPFIYNRLPEILKEKVTRIQLLSPSAYTDFEIHVSYLFISKKNSVISEVQKINKPIICYYGEDENDKPLQNVRMPNFKMVILNGEHHYEKSFAEIVQSGISAK
jgi:type IV secretory pathway VirJ component